MPQQDYVCCLVPPSLFGAAETFAQVLFSFILLS